MRASTDNQTQIHVHGRQEEPSAPLRLIQLPEHEPQTYWIQRLDMPHGPPVVIHRDIVCVRRTDDADADHAAALRELEAHGLIGCACCCWNFATDGA